jgi:beta-galactosidase
MIGVSNKGLHLHLDGKLLPLYSGTIHYWRLERKLWNGILDNVIKMGFEIIETYIPWAVHEIEKEKYDFGEIDKNKDLDAFLSLCEEKGLKILVRPGPHINAEITYFGYPERILYDKEIQALTNYNTPCIYAAFHKQFPIPSYASQKFYAETGEYFDALMPILLKHQYPKGGIIAIQSDNETCYFFKDKAYAVDYNKDSIQLYRDFLKDKYIDIESLNKCYRSKYKSFSEIEPPRSFNGKTKEELPYYFDWIRYKEYQIMYSLKRIARMWKDREINVPVFHNIAFQYYTPVDMINTEAMDEIDIAGIDIYRNKEDYNPLKITAKYLSGSSILPFIPEFGSGVWYDFGKTFTPEDEEFTTLYTFMHGIKAINYYMIVERERWQGSPITRDNRVREGYFNFYKKFNEFLKEYRFNEMDKSRKVLVLRNYDKSRFHSLYSMLDFVLMNIPYKLSKPSVDLSFKYINTDVDHWKRDEWVDEVSKALDEMGFDYDYSDTHLPLQKMKKYEVIFASTYDFMDRDEQEKLIQYVEDGGHLIIGPGVPYIDTNMDSCTVLLDFINFNREELKGSVTLIEHPAESEKYLNKIGLNKEFDVSQKEVELVVYEGNGRKLLFMANPTNNFYDVTLLFNGDKVLKAALNASDVFGKGAVSISIAPYKVMVWEVQR